MAKDEWDLPDEPGGRSLDDLDKALDQDFEVDPTRDDRTPVRKFASGIQEEMFSINAASSFVKKVGYQSLPKDYQNAFESYENVSDEVGKLYEHAKKEGAPAIAAAKKIGRTIVPGLEGFLPKSVYEKLQGIVAEDEAKGAVDSEEMEIASTLSGIFDAQQQNDAAQAKIQDKKDTARLAVEKQQFEASLGVSNNIALGISRLVGYQDNILSKYQRKSLELQHRQYFTTRQLLEVTRSTSEMLTSGIEKLIHNSALPNEAKAANMSEVWFQESKKRLFGSTYDSMQKRLGHIPKKIGENLRKQISAAMEGANEVLGGAADMAEMSQEMGGTSMLAGRMVGQMGAKKLQDMAIKGLSPFVENNETIKKGGHLLSMFGGNFWRFINEQQKKGKEMDSNWFQRTLYNLVGDEEKPDEITAHKALDAEQMTPISWDILSRRTLIEVIPGYLGKILKQATMANYLSNKLVESQYPNDKKYARQAYLNKLNRGIHELTFSTKQERFITVKEKRQQIMRDLSDKLTGSNMNRLQEQLLKEIIGTKKMISPSIQQEITKLMMRDSIKGLVFNPYRYANLTAADTPFYNEINSLFRRQYGEALEIFNPESSAAEKLDAMRLMGHDTSERLRKSSEYYNKFQSVAPDVQDVFNKYTNAEDRAALGFTDAKTGEFKDSLLALMNESALRGHGIDTPKKAKLFADALAEKDPKKREALLDKAGFSFTPVVPESKPQTTENKSDVLKRKREQAKRQKPSAAARGKPTGRPSGPKRGKGAQGKYYGGMVEYLAEGGAPRGFVDPTSASLTNTQDTIPTMLQEGEFIVPKHIVDRYGVDFFNNLAEINSGKKGIWSRIKNTVKPKGTMMLSHAEQQTALLARIARAVEHGYVAMPGGGVMQYGYFGKAGADLKKVLNDGWKKVKGLGESGIEFGKKSYRGFMDNVFNPATKWGRVRGKQLIRWGKKKYAKGKQWATDLYIEGEQRVSLAYSKLKAGHYYYLKEDGEKVFLREWKDLDGLSVDIYESTNNTIVVTKDQINKLRSLQLPDVAGFFSKIKEKAGDMFSSGMGMAGAAIDFARLVATKAVTAVYRKITAPVDVYVKGKIEEGPRLRRIMFINNGYRDSTGNIINHHDKINGPVYTMNASGKLEEALTQQDINDGLVELDGTPIEGTGVFGRMVNKGKRLAKGAWDIAAKVGNAGLSMAAGIAGAIGNIGSGIAGSIPGFSFNSGVEQRLDKIIKHMRIIHPLSIEDMKEIDRELPRSSMSMAFKEKWNEWKLKDKAKGQWEKLQQSEMADKLKGFKDKHKGKIDSIKDSLKSKKDKLKELWDKRRDPDGDGFIKGSWEEIKRQREEKKRAKEAGKMGPPKPPEEKGGIGKLLDGLKSFAMALISPFSGIFKIVTGLGSLLGTGFKVARVLAKPIGWAFKAARFATTRLAMPIARFAITQGLRVGATALAGLVGIPGLVIAAGAAIGYVVWKGYKYYKAKKTLSPLTKLRFLQYGLPEVGGTEANSPFAVIKQATKAYFGKEDARVVIHYLEDWCNDNVKVDDNGSFTPPKKEDIWNKFYKDFECEEDNVEHRQNLSRWFFKRFLPVYVWHVLAARATGNCTIQEADEKVPIKKKADYVKRVQFGKLEAIKLGVDPYTILSSPWPNTTLVTNREIIKMLSEAIKEASDAGTDLNPNASKLIETKQRAMTKTVKDESKIVKKNTFGRFLRDVTLRAVGKGEQADRELIKDSVPYTKPTKTGPEAPTFKAGQASVETTKDAKQLQEYLFSAAQAAGMKGEELAVFMANMHHETMGFKRFQENFNYKPEALLATFPKKIKDIEEARKLVNGGPTAIANHIYANMLGNKDQFDGYKYSGKGYIQLTGKENYEAAGKALGLDLVNNPDLAKDPANAAKIALWFWKTRGIGEAIKNAGSFNDKLIAARKKINGNRMLGLEDTGKLAAEYNNWVADKWVAKANAVTPPSNKMAESNQSANKTEVKAAQAEQKKQATAEKPQVASASTPAPAPAPTVNVAPPDLKPIAEIGAKSAEQGSTMIGQNDQMIQVLNTINQGIAALAKGNGGSLVSPTDTVIGVGRNSNRGLT